MRSNKSIRRLLAALLSIVMALALAIPAFALEIPDDRPDLAVIAGLYADWDGSYELPDLGQFPETDQEIIKAMVDEILISREAEAQAAAQAEIQDEIPLTISFTDVSSSHTFYRGIIYCAGKGIVNGYPDNTFRPGNTVTKNHFCAMLARGFYADQVEKYNTDYYKNTFGTFGPTNFTLAFNGTLNDTSFRWNYTDSVMNSGINRYDMAQLMTNIMKAKGFMASSSQKSAVQSKITDYKNIPAKYQDAVKNVYALGIITGYKDGSFVGTNIMNRGQAAIVIQRMAQYAPVKGDQDNNQYDDGTEQKPSTGNPGTGSGNTGNTSSSSTGSSGSGNTGTTTTEPKPEPKPETPAVRTLANGKPITESNVTAILEQLKAKYFYNDNFSKGYAGLGSGRTPSKNCIAQVTNRYGVDTAHNQHVSTTTGCGGWAAFVADEIFGQTNVTWKKTSIANARPGDLMVILDDAGYLMHVSIYVSEASGFPKTKMVYNTGASRTNGVYTIGWANTSRPSTNDIDVWTAYPD